MDPLEWLGAYFVTHPHPLLEAKTIQVLLLREVLDYTVLRTEETRELNTVITPISINGQANERRVAFLATKQKAAESREMEQMLRTATRAARVHTNKECYLKDRLCMECPRCGLFGATNVQAGAERIGNIRHRVEYGTAFSLMPFEDVSSVTTFNGVVDMTQKTEQALGSRYAVIPASIFPSVVTLRSVTRCEFVLMAKTLLASRSYGAESRIGGDVRNTIVGIVAGWEEIITPLEFVLELYTRCVEPGEAERRLLDGKTVGDIVGDYLQYAGNPKKVKICTSAEVDAIVQAAAETELDASFLQACYDDIRTYRKIQEEAGKKQ